MKTTYVETTIQADETTRETLIALLAHLGYEAFEEAEEMVKAYIPIANFNETAVQQMSEDMGAPTPVHHEIPPQNWNAKWEEEYPSVYVDQFCQIVPTFRAPMEGFVYTMKIDPKMAFGTGHHATTRSVIRQMADLQLSHMEVLDMGCGTGVLGILARMMGANHITAIDIDPWSEENTRENIQINQMDGFDIFLGGKEVIPDRTYDLILANINRNVLLQDIPDYSRHMVSGGKLILSGFYTEDQPLIEEVAQKAGFIPGKSISELNWVALALVKS